MKFFIATVLVFLLTLTGLSQKPKDLTKATLRADESVELLKQFGKLGSKSLPFEYLRGAKAVAVFPGVKKYSILLSQLLLGHGLVSVRSGDEWSKPVFLTLKGSDMNFKIADKETFDLVVLFLTDKSIESLKKGVVANKGVVLGPVVKGQGADKALADAHVLYYAFSDGQLIDTDLKNNWLMGGFGIVHDNNLNKAIFGMKGRDIFMIPEKSTAMPVEVDKFRTTLSEILAAPSPIEPAMNDGSSHE